MTDSLEAELRTTLRECAGLMPDDAAGRLAGVDYWPRAQRSRRRLRIWSVASTVGVAIAGCAVAAFLFFSILLQWAAGRSDGVRGLERDA